MRAGRSLAKLSLLGAIALGLFLSPATPEAEAYVDGGPLTLGGLCAMSTHITVVRIENYSPEKRVIIYRKVADLKGNYPRDHIKHLLGPTHGAKPDILQPGQTGKTVI